MEKPGNSKREVVEYIPLEDDDWGDFWGGEGPDNGDWLYHPEGSKKDQKQ